MSQFLCLNETSVLAIMPSEPEAQKFCQDHQGTCSVQSVETFKAHPSLEVARADIMYDITVLLNTLKKYNLRDVGRSDEEREQLIRLRETLEELL